MNTQIRVSINNTVRVKLSPEARHHLFNKGIVPNKSDLEGYSEWQLWQLFELFGDAISIDKPTCFEDGIFIDRNELNI